MYDNIKIESVQELTVNININFDAIRKANNKNDNIYDKNNNEEIDKKVNAENKQRKIDNMRIQKAYLNLNMLNKAERLALCFSHLEFFKFYDKDKMKLTYANSCHVRMCNQCAYRRSLKYYRDNNRIFTEFLKRNKNAKFIFLTLTDKNATSGTLSAEITKMLYAFKKFINYKRVDKCILATIRSLEVTYNQKTNTFHHHVHCIIAVNNTYFKSENYITQAEYTLLWQKALNVNYSVNLDVRMLKNRNSKLLAEISKYTVKFADIMQLDDKKLEYVISILENALSNRRCVAYTKQFKDIRKELKISDELQNKEEINEEMQVDEIGYKIIYNWHFNKREYIREE